MEDDRILKDIDTEILRVTEGEKNVESARKNLKLI
jgi:hypothetical protein